MLGLMPRELIDSPGLAAWKASALQEPPPKCLIFILPGYAMLQQSAQPVPYLNNLAAEGCSGLLALRDTSASGGGDLQGCENALAQFLGIHEPAGKQSLADRYASMYWQS